ncbi:membrane protein CcdC involved in cytochrome C biogenesis [Lederbergia wuyishanensis]|uniref:Membrane protein CcdC involved in cytochrome C biogenesis n=1 Tax=Lederbergia wuyishanensis TaxID=1347903 RepID=A0ABU0D022_9BACI|nr:membrane protein CcdC involved in cytochrome C biogenesis [Lederbergia wuyishanensis]
MKILIPSILAVMMSIGVIFIRMKASHKPVSAKKIILPPVFMSTGALMFVSPYFRVTGMEIVEASIVGILFSLLLIKTSKFEVRDNAVYLKRSKAFAFILIALLIIRIVAKSILSQQIDVGQLSGMFWILAFGMIVPWRIAMFIQYKKLVTT